MQWRIRASSFLGTFLHTHSNKVAEYNMRSREYPSNILGNNTWVIQKTTFHELLSSNHVMCTMQVLGMTWEIEQLKKMEDVTKSFSR
jgi:hypothetical protein